MGQAGKPQEDSALRDSLGALLPSQRGSFFPKSQTPAPSKMRYVFSPICFQSASPDTPWGPHTVPQSAGTRRERIRPLLLSEVDKG